MDGWLRRSASEQGGPAAKVRAVSPSEDSELVRKAVTLVSKMTLRQELEIRELQAAVFKCFALKEPNPLIPAAKDAVATFLEQAKKARSTGARPPPGDVQAYVWAAITGVVIELSGQESSGHQLISSHRAAMTSPEQLMTVVHLAKMKKAFNKGEFKLYLALRPDHQELLQAVADGIVAKGGEEKQGVAPPSRMACELQEIVDRFGGQNGH